MITDPFATCACGELGMNPPSPKRSPVHVSTYVRDGGCRSAREARTNCRVSPDQVKARAHVHEEQFRHTSAKTVNRKALLNLVIMVAVEEEDADVGALARGVARSVCPDASPDLPSS